MQQSFALLGALAVIFTAHLTSAERVLGAYIFARHGDRTPKILGDTRLTDLGYKEVYLTGGYYHNRYVTSDSPLQIEGISEPFVNTKQVQASSPPDEVLQNSATGFLQGVYPPVGVSANETLRNGTTVESPLDGYQLVPLSAVSSGTNSEDSTWLQKASGCKQATVSSGDFYGSDLYNSLLTSTNGFYESLSPMLDRTFNASQRTFKNAYKIFDYLNVASIHNSSSDFPSSELLTADTYHQLLTLANVQQYNLAYNASDPVRAIEGSTLAGDVQQGLEKIVTTQGKSKLGIQFGSYGTFLSYFGLAQLPSVDVNFTGIPDYASSMAWELVTNSTASGFPSIDEISVRFIFHNGTINGFVTPTSYPLYGQSSIILPWTEFLEQSQNVAVTSQDQWCEICGNTDGLCASASTTAADSSKSGGMSKAVAGVVGAMVTLGVILGLEALFFVVGGFRISKRRKAGSVYSTEHVSENKTP